MFWNCEIDFRFKSSRKILQSRDQMVPQCKDGGKIDTSEPECREDWLHPGQDAVKIERIIARMEQDRLTDRLIWPDLKTRGGHSLILDQNFPKLNRFAWISP